MDCYPSTLRKYRCCKEWHSTQRGLPHDVGVEKGCWLEKEKDGVTSPCEGHAHRMKSLPLRFMVYHFNMAIRP